MAAGLRDVVQSTSVKTRGSHTPDSAVFVGDSHIHGKGLFARTLIPAGEIIGTLRGEYTTTDGEHVLWLNSQQGFQVHCELRYINHSAEPNAVYYDNLEVTALRDIHPGEEITHDYDANSG